MSKCTNCKKQVALRIITSLLDLKSKDIETGLHISKSVVSRYLNGERGCTAIDIFMIESLFGIKVKDYSIND